MPWGSLKANSARIIYRMIRNDTIICDIMYTDESK